MAAAKRIESEGDERNQIKEKADPRAISCAPLRTANGGIDWELVCVRAQIGLGRNTSVSFSNSHRDFSIYMLTD